MFRGALVPCFEVPARADHVLAELQRRKLGTVQHPDAFDDAALARIHSPRYLRFLATAWDQWLALDPANADKDILPSVWPTRTFRTDIEPDNFSAKVGLYSFDAGTPFTRAPGWRRVPGPNVRSAQRSGWCRATAPPLH
jgi:acetoin utilization deacetylase AcuC-like enzyme